MARVTRSGPSARRNGVCDSGDEETKTTFTAVLSRAFYTLSGALAERGPRLSAPLQHSQRAECAISTADIINRVKADAVFRLALSCERSGSYRCSQDRSTTSLSSSPRLRTLRVGGGGSVISWRKTDLVRREHISSSALSGFRAKRRNFSTEGSSGSCYSRRIRASSLVEGGSYWMGSFYRTLEGYFHANGRAIRKLKCT